MQILNNSTYVLNSSIQENSTSAEEIKDRFELFLEKSNLKKEEENERESFLEDINFVAKTGFTKEELELIKKILEEIQKQRAESGQTPGNMEDYIRSLKQDLQAAIYEATGKRVDVDEDMVNNFLKSQNNSNELIAKATTDEELRLIDKLKGDSN